MSLLIRTVMWSIKYYLYDAYSESKYRFTVKKSSLVSYKSLLLSNSTFFKIFFQIFAAIFEVLVVAGHKFLYTLVFITEMKIVYSAVRTGSFQ